MTKINRPRGLIRYDSMHGLSGKATRWLRPRIFLYTALLLLGTAAMMAGLSTLRAANVSLTRVTGIPYVVENGVVRNQFLLRVINKRNAPATYSVEIRNAPAGMHWSGAEGGIALTPLSEEMRPIIVTFPRADLKTEVPLTFRVTSTDGRTTVEKTATFLGPVSP